MKTYWVSFAGDDGNKGVIITDAEDEAAAIKKITDLGLNPGGEAMLFDMGFGGDIASAEVQRWGKDRLIKPEDLLSVGYHKSGEVDLDKLESAPGVSVICNDCNKEGA